MEREVKIRVIAAIIYGVIAGVLAIIVAGCVDGTATVGMTANIAVAGILFGILAVIELVKAERLAKGE